MTDNKVLEAFNRFAEEVKQKLSSPVYGEPEDQLRGPFEQLVKAMAAMGGHQATVTGEVSLGAGLGRPDYGISINGVLTGYAELKAPGKGADGRFFKGHDKAQFEKFKAIPNLLYTDGNHWVLYRDGEQCDHARFSYSLEKKGLFAVDEGDISALNRVFQQFLFWEPRLPAGFKELAAALAPLCRYLRDDVLEAVKNPGSNLIRLAADWRNLLFPESSDERFADAYAQTVTFALLLAKLDGADVMDLDRAVNTLKTHHSVLSRALQILTDNEAIREIEPAVRLLQRTISAVREQTSTGHEDPWLYFYEDFLAAYDEKLRKDYGVYYTPVEVVRCQVRLIDELLRTRLKKPLGFASEGVITLDPAVGTGTYLLGVIEHALKQVEAKQGKGAVPAQASSLARNLYAFEFMVGPFAVAELRLSRALADRNASLPDKGLSVYLTDTLESPNAQVVDLSLYLRAISDQHKRALEVKKNIPVLVCLGNPPYDRHSAAKPGERGASGNWVRHGDTFALNKVDKGKGGGKKDYDITEAEAAGGADAILKAFIEPAQKAGLGVHVKNLYNLYVYFWRWALWKVFERNGESGAGVVSFITASSYLSGPGFAGMREHLRRVCDEIWILDLGGEGRGADMDDNVFNIQTPVAIGIAFRRGAPKMSTAAVVQYARISGKREIKLKALNDIHSLKDLTWETCPDGWLDKFTPIATGDYASWPLITDIFPWQHTGAEIKRLWPIAPDEHTLRKRWAGLLCAHDRATAFVETRDRTIQGSYPQVLGREKQPRIADATAKSPVPVMSKYSYRSLDRQVLLSDGRICDYLRPPLWETLHQRQVFFTSLLTSPIGNGPALMAAGYVPDRHHFSSRGGKDVIPLYRDAEADAANVTPEQVHLLSDAFGKKIVPEDLFAYCYGVLAHPAFSVQFAGDQKRDGVRVPITRDYALFKKAAEIGRRLIWLHTYGERFVPMGKTPGDLPAGAAKCVEPVPDAPEKYPNEFNYDPYLRVLHVGGGQFAPVAPAVWEFEVSGLRVVRSWLGYRMRERKGKKSSPLDDIYPERWTSEFTTELLNLLWILEATLKQYPEQEALFAQIIEGPLFTADDLPKPPDWMRKPPNTKAGQAEFEME
ncbi:MAG TPA: N-6 DNA methylase [Candidatus Hydrogenedentes bacterium]|nr:N-6 DNA methylase [Candidatus Hydrogenedentota bacterium]